MEAEILNGVGKKMRYAYLNGNITEEAVISRYNKNKREADAFSLYGYTLWEIRQFQKKCFNPLLKKKIEETAVARKELTVLSKNQNKMSLIKLQNFKENACEIGLRKVIRKMKKLSKASDNIEMKAVLVLLEIEFANLSAKLYTGWHRKKIYERKTLLLLQLADILKQLHWKYGVNCTTGKNANYLVYVYLPNDVQLTWHCNEYDIYVNYPEIDAQWDGQVCMTMEKILRFIAENYITTI